MCTYIEEVELAAAEAKHDILHQTRVRIFSSPYRDVHMYAHILYSYEVLFESYIIACKI